MKVYYAHPMNLYNSLQESRDIETLELLGFEVVNPNQQKYQDGYKEIGMDIFYNLVKECQVFAFRTFPDGMIGAGIVGEMHIAKDNNKPIIELPTLTSTRELSIYDTREYLKMLGAR